MGVVESPTTPTEGILHFRNDPYIPYKEAFFFMVFLGRYKTHAVILRYWGFFGLEENGGIEQCINDKFVCLIALVFAENMQLKESILVFLKHFFCVCVCDTMSFLTGSHCVVNVHIMFASPLVSCSSSCKAHIIHVQYFMFQFLFISTPSQLLEFLSFLPYQYTVCQETCGDPRWGTASDELAAT